MPNRLVLCLGLLVACTWLQMPAAAEEPAPTKLLLSASATREVEQDTLVGVLSVRSEATRAATAQAEVNGRMTEAVAKARAVAGVRAATGGYRVYQDYDKDGRPRRWIAEQDLRLTAREAAPLLELVGTLQAGGLSVTALTYELGAEARRTIEDELTIEAIQTLRNRAEQVAASIAMRVLTIATLQVGAAPGEPPGRPMFRASLAEAAPSPPPLALPDLETVGASVQAELILAPR